MNIISTKTTYHDVTIEVPRGKGAEMTLSIGDQFVTLNKWQAELLADYLREEIKGMQV